MIDKTNLKRIKVKQDVLTSGEKQERLKDMAAKVAYYYPRYSFDDAMKLNIRLVRRLLKTVSREHATMYLNQTQIAAAPKTPKGSGVKKLMENYGRIARG